MKVLKPEQIELFRNITSLSTLCNTTKTKVSMSRVCNDLGFWIV